MRWLVLTVLLVLVAAVAFSPVSAQQTPVVNQAPNQGDGGETPPDFVGYCAQWGGRVIEPDGPRAPDQWPQCITEDGAVTQMNPQLVCEFSYPDWYVEASPYSPAGVAGWTCLLTELKRIPTPTPIPVQTVDIQGTGSANPAVFEPGDRVEVNIFELNIREQSGLTAIQGRLNEGQVVYVLSQRFYYDGWVWIYVRYTDPDGVRQYGWIATGTSNYPYVVELPHECAGANAPQLAVGERVINIRIFSVPVYTRYSRDSDVDWYLTPDVSVNVQYGPVCRNGQFWWYVQSVHEPELTGWVSEGFAGETRVLALAPRSFYNAYPAYYHVGMQGQIDDAPVAMRYWPGGKIIPDSYMAPYTGFTIIGDAVCIEGLEGALCYYLVRSHQSGIVGWIPLGYADRPAWFTVDGWFNRG